MHVAALAAGWPPVVMRSSCTPAATILAARRVPLCDGVVVDHVPAGPAVVLPKDDLLPHMPARRSELAAAWRPSRPTSSTRTSG